MRRALASYLERLWRDGSHRAAVVAAAEVLGGSPAEVVRHAGLLARCRVEVAAEDLGLTEGLAARRPDGRTVVARVPAGAPYPVLVHSGRRRRGAFDTPLCMARQVVSDALDACSRPVTRGLDPACGTGAFLVAMAEQGIPEVVGSDLDAVALDVARVAVPGARLSVADALQTAASADLVVGNPPFVPPERQDKELRRALRIRFPWLRGRFDLVIPFAASAVHRARAGGGVGLVLPAPALVQPYGAPLRRRWVLRHRVVQLGSPRPFPGAAVDVVILVLRKDDGPAPLPDHGLHPDELVRLEAVPLDPALAPGDVELVEAIRRVSVPLGQLCLVDTGVVSHGPRGGRERLLHDEPGPGRVPYADAKDFFAGRRRWLQYTPADMHRAKRPEMFERPKIVVQRLRGRNPVRAAVDRDGVYVGHTCTVVCPRDRSVPLERLVELIRSPLVDGLTRIERGGRLDLYPRDVAAIPVPTAWLVDPAQPLATALGLSRAEVHRLRGLASGGSSGRG